MGPLSPLACTSATLVRKGMLLSPSSSAACSGFLLFSNGDGGAGTSGDADGEYDGDEENNGSSLSMTR